MLHVDVPCAIRIGLQLFANSAFVLTCHVCSFDSCASDFGLDFTSEVVSELELSDIQVPNMAFIHNVLLLWTVELGLVVSHVLSSALSSYA